MEEMIWTMILMLGIVIVVFLLVYSNSQRKIEKLQRYWDVEIGMPEYQMLNIMGDGYSRSLLKNNRVKYEWRINATSYGSSYKGISTRVYYGVKKVAIYTKDGRVEEVKPYNV